MLSVTDAAGDDCCFSGAHAEVLLMMKIRDWTGKLDGKLEINVGCVLCMFCYMKAHKGTILRIAARVPR